METTPAAKQKIKYLVADTTAFINAVQLNDYADNVLTVPDVIKEVRNKRQIRRLCVLPFDLQVREPRAESVKHCVEFAKKTGDYASLSGIDIKVIALSYELEADNVGTAHLRTEPVMSKVVASKEKPEEFQETNVKLAGWYNPKDGENTEDEEEEETEENEVGIVEEQNDKSEDAEVDMVKKRIEAQLENANSSDCHENEDDEDADVDMVKKRIEAQLENANSSDCHENEDDEITQEELDALFEKLKCEATEDSSCNILIPQSPTDDDSDCDGDATTTNIQLKTSETIGDTVEEDFAEDDGAWITPANIKKVKKSLEGKVENDVVPLVACMSTDYALQNVLKQLNLQICALDGRVIKHLRTYILRCYACFKTTSIMTKVFCPNCGNKTLKRVAVSLDANGKQVIHINTRRPLSSKYKNQSLPRFQGGKHSRNPILFEDQPIPRQMPSRVAKTKTNALNEDYTAGFSPFVMRDVDSKSALLRSKGHLKEWARNNTFEEDRRRKHYNRVYK